MSDNTARVTLEVPPSAAQLANRRARYVSQEIALAARNAGVESVFRQTALRIGSDVILNGGSTHAAVEAGKRYIASRVVRSQLDRFDKREPVSTWVAGFVFGAAVLIAVYEAAVVMGIAP